MTDKSTAQALDLAHETNSGLAVTKVRNHNLKRNRQGSAIIWILVWLTGLAGIAWAGYTFAIPRYEQRLQASVQDAIASHTDLPVIIAAKGNVVTLTGQAATAETLSAITDAAASTAGVRAVKTNMTLIGSAQPSDSISANAEQVAQLDVTAAAIDPDTNSEPVDPTPDTDIAESSLPLVAIGDVDEPDNKSDTDDNKSDTDNAEAPSETDSTATDDNSAIVASESQPTELPTFKMRIVDEILVLEGRISNSDDTNVLIQNAMTSFNVDVVSNGLIYSDDVAKAEWLESIEGVMPLMGLMKDPQISVLERQITLIGAAPNREVHDDVISQALNSLGEFSLVERVSIDPAPENTEVAAADTELTSTASDSTDATPIEDAIEAATTIGADPSVSIEPESLGKTEAPAESEATVEPVASAEPEAPAETEATVEPVASVEPEAPAETEAPIEPVASVEPEAPAETEAPIEPVASVESEAPAETEAPIEPVASVEPEAPAETEVAVEPVAPVEPEAPAETEVTIEPVALAESESSIKTRAPLDPMDPAPSAEPEEPVETKAAVEPVASAAPEAPTETVAPVESAASAEPEAPVETKTPVESVASAEPEAPSETEAPVEPIAAAEPLAPVETEAPQEPVASAEPEAPSKPAPSPEPATTVVAINEQSGQNEELRTALSELPTLRILFETDVNVLTAKSQIVLDQIADALMRFPDTSVAIEGHTDATGDQTLNLELSLLRATTVRDYLIDKGVSVYSLRALGFGEEVPIADNQTAEGRAINRRIEFTF